MTTADRHALTLLAADALADTMPPEDLLDAVGELDDLADDEFAALFEDRPATFGDLAARPSPVSLPVVFSEAPADKQFSLPGPAGERAYNLMAHLRAEGTRTLYRLAERAVSRLVADPAAAQSAYTLFDDDELAELRQSLAATVAAADMLGRARIAQLAAMKQKAKTFAEYTLTQSRTGGPKAVAPGKPPLYGDDAIAAAKGEKQPAELPASVPAELRRPDIPDTEDVDIHSGGDVFWSGSHANAKALVNEAFKQDGPAGVAGLEIRRKGAGEVRKSQQAAPAPVKAEPLPPPSDYASFETGTPLRATVFRGETRGGSGTGMAAMGHGKYYGLEPAVAERFSVPESVKATTVELKNPVVIKSDDDMVAIKKAAEKATGFDFGRDGNLYEGFLHGDQPAKFTAALIRMGYDGLLTTYAGAPGGQQLLVFPPKTFSEWYFPKQSHRSFAEGDEFAAFAEPVPPRPPLEALDYFRKLVPSLDNDPLRYGPLLDRHAFTLAYATDQTMLESVKRALLANLAGQTESANLIAGLEGERNVRGAELVQSILDRAGVSPRNPQYSEMVYRTNTLDAYHQGMQRELAKPEVQEMFPAWRYLGIKDGREGDDHRPNFGRVYPVKMPFTKARGPRSYNCRCSAQPMDREELKLFTAAGGVVETVPQYGQ